MTEETKLQKLARLYYEADNDLEEVEGLEMVEEGDWVDDGKYSHKQSFVKFEDTEFAVTYSRSGSYYTDYYYSPTAFQEIVRTPVQKIVYEVEYVGPYQEVDEE